MCSFGNLVFYGKNGLSDPYTLSYGKTTIGSTIDHHIRIKGDNEMSCVLDTNEFGVTTLVNEQKNTKICIDGVPTEKYTIMKDGVHLELGKIKFKYSNPNLNEMYLQQTQQTLNKKCGLSENIGTNLGISTNPPSAFNSSQNIKKRRYSTGSKPIEAINSPKFVKKNSSVTSTPQSVSKLRFSHRMISRRNSTLAAVKENESCDFQSPVINVLGSPIPKKRSSYAESPLARKNKTFSGNSDFSSPVPAKNKTYSGNMSDISDNVTTPENTVHVAAITPLNVSKSKSKISLNRSKTMSYVDFPDSSSTPKSALKANRSTSLYKPLVEDITPASPLPSRSSLRPSSLKKPACTQRRSVNFNVSSTSESSFGQIDEAGDEKDLEESLTGIKRKRTSNASEYTGSAKKSRSIEPKESFNEDHDQDSNNSVLSGIQNLSDTSFSSNKCDDRSKNIVSLRGDEDMVSWHEEMPQNDSLPLLESANSSFASSPSSSFARSDVQLPRSKTRSRSLNLERKSRKSTDKLSKTLGNDLKFAFSDEKDRSVLEESLEGKVSSTPLLRGRSRSLAAKKKSPLLKTRSQSMIGKKPLSTSFRRLSQTSMRKSLNISPIKRSSRKSGKVSCSPGDSTREIFGSLLEESLPDYDESTNKLFGTENQLETSGRSRNQSTRSSLRSSSDTTSDSSIFALKTPGKSSLTSSSSPASSTLRRSESILVSESYESSNASVFGSSSVEDLEDGSTVSAPVFKTPRPKTPSRKSQTPSRASQTSNLSLKTPTRMSQTPNRTSQTPNRTSQTPNRISHTPNRSSQTPNRASQTPNRASQTPNRTSQIPSRTSQTPNRASQTPNRPSRPPSRKSQTLQDPTDVTSIEKVFEETLAKTPRKSTRLSIQDIEDSLDNLVATTTGNEEDTIEIAPKVGRRSSIKQKTPKNDSSDVSGLEESSMTLKKDLSDVASVRELLPTPNARNIPKIVVQRVQNSPKNDLTDVRGLKSLLKTPRVQKSPRNDLTQVVGVKKLLKTPKAQKSPQNDLSNIAGVKSLLKTPKVQKSPRNDLTNIAGVKKLLKTPKVQQSPNNDLTNVGGVKKLLKTPKVQNTPKNDLTNVGGVKKLMKSPAPVQKSPKNDLTDVRGLKKLMKSPKRQKSPKNDLSDVRGVRKMFSPKVQKQPENNLLDVRGIRQLLKTPKNKPANESHDLSGIDILFNESQDSAFDKLLEKKPVRTYGRSPNASKSLEKLDESETTHNVLKWLEDQSELRQTPSSSASSKGKRKLDQTLETSEVKSAKKIKQTEDSTIEMNVSTNILGKPASTPVVSKDSPRKARQTGKKNISNTEKLDVEVESQPARNKRKFEKEEEKQPSPKKRRGRTAKINTTKDQDLQESVKVAEKPTRNTRKATKKDVAEDQDSQESVKIDEKPTRKTRKAPKKEDSEDQDLQESVKVDKKPTRSTKRAPKIDDSEDQNLQESVKVNQKPTRSAKRAPKKEDSDQDLQESVKVDEKSTRSTRRAPKKENSDQDLQESVKVDQKPSRSTKRAPKKDDSEDQDLQESIKVGQKPTRSTKRAPKKEDSEQDLQESVKVDQKPTRSTKRAPKKEDSEQDLQESVKVDQKPTRSTKRAPKKEDSDQDLQESVKVDQKPARSTKRVPKKDDSEEQDLQESLKVDEKPTRSTRRAPKKDDSEAHVLEESSTRTRRGRKPKEIDNDSVNKIEEKQTKQTRGKKVQDTSNKEELSESTEQEKEKIVKKPAPKTRGTKKKEVDATEEDVTEKETEINTETNRTKRGRNVRKEKNDSTNESEEPERKTKTNKKEKIEDAKEPAKKTRAKKVVEEAKEEEQTRSTRSNKGKNQKYDEDEWDTPVKNNRGKRGVHFRETIHTLQTPEIEQKPSSGRSLRKRK